MADPRERRQFERIEKDASAVASVANHQAGTVTPIIESNFDRGEFAGEYHVLILRRFGWSGYMRNSKFGSGSLLFSNTTFLYFILKPLPFGTNL